MSEADDWSLPCYLHWVALNMFEWEAVPRWWARPFARFLPRKP